MLRTLTLLALHAGRSLFTTEDGKEEIGGEGGRGFCYEHEALRHFEFQGGVAIWIFAILYVFYALAILCDLFFIPCLKIISRKLRLPEDVAGASFMAFGCAAPELFLTMLAFSDDKENVADLGFGTIVGSGVYSFLVILSVAALASTHVMHIEPGPFLRDSFVYVSSVVLLIVFIWDKEIQIYEAAIMIGWYFVYLTVLFVSGNAINRFNAWLKRDLVSTDRTEEEQLITPSFHEAEEHEVENVPWHRQTTWGKVLMIFQWPPLALFSITIPNTARPEMEKWWPLAFIICTGYLGGASWGLIFLLKRVLCTLNLSEAFVGIIFVAVGTDIPDTIAVIFVARRGFAQMAASNIFGSQILMILVGLGIPALVGTLLGLVIGTASEGIVISSGILLGVSMLFVGSIVINRMVFSKVMGFFFLLLYVCFVVYEIYAVYNAQL